MCTLALYFQEFADFPLIVAANRDEFFHRPSASPHVLLTDPLIIGGKDLLAGGTWLGINQYGLLAGILNRRSGTEKNQASLRSRGLLCLDVLAARDPLQACAFLKGQKGSAYQPFNLLFANPEHAYVAYDGGEEISCIKLGKGLHVLSNTSLYDARSEKMDQAHLLFSRAKGHLREWDFSSGVRVLREVLSDHVSGENSNNPKDAICVHTESYGTVSSTIIFYSRVEKRYHTYYAPGPPCNAEHEKSLTLDVV